MHVHGRGWWRGLGRVPVLRHGLQIELERVRGRGFGCCHVYGRGLERGPVRAYGRGGELSRGR
eukprot:1321876-Pleurochrysis_carterae.AAC.3